MKKKTFYKFLSEHIKHDNNIWSYIEELWVEYNRKPNKKDKIDDLLDGMGLEGYPAWNDEGTKLLKYKDWDIWAVNEKDSQSWGLFAIRLRTRELLPLATQVHIFAVDILKEELKKLVASPHPTGGETE